MSGTTLESSDIISTYGSYTIRRANADDACEIAALMQSVYDNMVDKDTFICDDIDFVRRHIETEGFILVAENRTLSALCGVFIIRYPQKADDNLGYYIDLPADELLKVAHMESCVVGKGDRGHHLEAEMMRAAEEHMDEKYTILMGVASPRNIASIKSLTGNGFTLVKENIDYYGHKRNIYIKRK